MSVHRAKKILRVLRNFIKDNYSDVLEVEDNGNEILIRVRNGNSGGGS